MELDDPLKSYLQLMDDGTDTQGLQKPSDDAMKNYGVEYLNQEYVNKRSDKFSIRLVYVGFSASIAAYYVDIGYLRVTINLLNLPGKVLDPSQKHIGSGSYGTVFLKTVNGVDFVAKVMERKTFKPQEIEEAVREVAISKLCALYGIGPDVETSIPFDLIVSDDAIQFHLEQCQCLEKSLKKHSLQELEEKGLTNQIRKCFQILHSLHIAHRDIRPDNILWCKGRNRFVLCDFGLSTYVKEGISNITYDQHRVRTSDQIEDPLWPYLNDVRRWKDSYSSMMKQQKKKMEQQSSQKQISPFSCGSSPSPRGDSYKFQPIVIATPVKQEPVIVTGPFKKPDSYEFYRLVFAATSLTHHKFSFEKNLPSFNQDQRAFIYNILRGSLNKPKIEKAIEELEAMETSESSPWSHWLEEFKRSLITNFDEHKPRIVKAPIVTLQWVRKLIRLIGRTEVLATIEAQLRSSQYSIDNEQTVWVLAKEFAGKTYRKLLIPKQQITLITFCLERGIKPEDFRHIVLLGYDIAEWLFNDIQQSLENPQGTNLAFLNCFATSLRRQQQAAGLLCYLETEKSFERCVFVSIQYWQLYRQRSDNMLRIVKYLLERFRMEFLLYRRVQFIYIQHIKYLVEESLGLLDREKVRSPFTKFMKLTCLLENTNSHQYHLLLNLQLAMRISYCLKYKIIQQLREAFVEFEMHRQFYSEMCPANFNEMIQTTYEREKSMRPPKDEIPKELNERLQLQEQCHSLHLQGRHADAIEILKKMQMSRIGNNSSIPPVICFLAKVSQYIGQKKMKSSEITKLLNEGYDLMEKESDLNLIHEEDQRSSQEQKTLEGYLQDDGEYRQDLKELIDKLTRIKDELLATETRMQHQATNITEEVALEIRQPPQDREENM